MRNAAQVFIVLAAVVAAAGGGAAAFPLGISAGGGIGLGYYSMGALNEHIGIVAQENAITIDPLNNGINFRAEGRIWYGRIAALVGGYEHLWAETETLEATSSITYLAPADVYTLGLVAALFRFENAIDLGVGVNRCWVDVTYGTNEITGRRLAEFDGEDAGYEAYAEIRTNFLNPIEVGLQIGYRGLKVETLSDLYGERGYFEPGFPIEVDYSGVFFSLMTSIRIN